MTVGLLISAAGLAVPGQALRTLVQGIGIATGLLGAILLFTRRIQHPDADRVVSDPRTFPPIFRAGYAFGLIGFVMPAVLMFLPDVELGASHRAGCGAECRASETAKGDGAAPAVSRAVHLRDGSHDTWHWEPIAILIGCDFEAPEDGEAVGSAACGSLDPQWVVSVGGWVLDCGFTDACGARAPAARDASEGTPPDAAGAEREPEAPAAAPADAESDAVPPSRAEELAPSEIAEAKTVAATRCAFGNCLASHAHPISGGVVVPIYFVLIALLGGAIGLLRKLPEIQLRSDDQYRPAEGDSTKLTPNQARDFVLFQLIQLLAAPIIGVVAFSIAEPDSMTATVVLAFAAGFSSEPFLLMVREYAERISGVAAKKVPLVDGAALVPGRLIRLTAAHEDRAAGSVGVVVSYDAAKLEARVQFTDPGQAQPVEESIPIGKLIVG